MTVDELLAVRAKRMSAEGGPFFMGLPERWLDDPTWRCTRGHVSKRYLKTDDGDQCLECFAPVILTHPEDTEPL